MSKVFSIFRNRSVEKGETQIMWDRVFPLEALLLYKNSRKANVAAKRRVILPFWKTAVKS